MSINFIVVVKGTRDMTHISEELLGYCRDELIYDAIMKGSIKRQQFHNVQETIEVTDDLCTTYFIHVDFLNYEYDSPNLHFIFFNSPENPNELVACYQEHFGGVIESIPNDEIQHFIIKGYNHQTYNEAFVKGQQLTDQLGIQ